MKKFCELLREHAMKIINFKSKKLNYLQKSSRNHLKMQKFVIFIIFFIIFLTYIRTSKNLSAKYYQENKERLQKKARERYQNLSKEEKEKKQQYCRERQKNLSEEKK